MINQCKRKSLSLDSWMILESITDTNQKWSPVALQPHSGWLWKIAVRVILLVGRISSRVLILHTVWTVVWKNGPDINSWTVANRTAGQERTELGDQGQGGLRKRCVETFLRTWVWCHLNISAEVLSHQVRRLTPVFVQWVLAHNEPGRRVQQRGYPRVQFHRLPLCRPNLPVTSVWGHIFLTAKISAEPLPGCGGEESSQRPGGSDYTRPSVMEWVGSFLECICMHFPSLPEPLPITYRILGGHSSSPACCDWPRNSFTANEVWPYIHGIHASHWCATSPGELEGRSTDDFWSTSFLPLN